jgi:hypothetical protein
MKNLKIEISHRAEAMLEDLTRDGIYGSTKEEVATRFVEEKLREFCAKPFFQLAEKAAGGEALIVRR